MKSRFIANLCLLFLSTDIFARGLDTCGEFDDSWVEPYVHKPIGVTLSGEYNVHFEPPFCSKQRKSCVSHAKVIVRNGVTNKTDEYEMDNKHNRQWLVSNIHVSDFNHSYQIIYLHDEKGICVTPVKHLYFS